MQTVNHKQFGTGEVVNKEVKENGTYITVRFSNGKELVLGIPSSFKTDVVQALGDLKEEVDKALEEEKLKKEALKASIASTIKSTIIKTKTGVRNPVSNSVIKCPIQVDYENYLESQGYPVVGKTGNDSTVHAYSRAVRTVVENEGITWYDLAKAINKIIPKYDTGGKYERIGNKSNKTVINALKRFAEFI
jgi:hypothetical protein